MSKTPVCPQCGLRVPSDAPLGLCPRCLMDVSPAETATYRPVAAYTQPIALGASVADVSALVAAIRELDLVSPGDLDHHVNLAESDPSRLARALVQAKKLTPLSGRGFVARQSAGTRDR